MTPEQQALVDSKLYTRTERRKASFAGAPGSEFCRCCTCGYRWQRGEDGSHYCTENLLNILNSVRRVATGKDQVADDDTGGLDWIADYISAMLGDTPHEKESHET